MDEGSKFFWKCTIREIVKYVAIFVVAMIVILYGIPRQVDDVNRELGRTQIQVSDHNERIRNLEAIVREQAFTTREIERKLSTIDANIRILIEAIQDSGNIKFMTP